MRFRTVLGVALAAAMGFPGSVARAQISGTGSFQTYQPVVNAGTPFFDNRSNNGGVCNIGFVLERLAGAFPAVACSNQRPSRWLPYDYLPPRAYYSTSTFTVAGGGWDFAQRLFNLSLGGNLLGENTVWGVYSVADRANRWNLNAVEAANGGQFPLISNTITQDEWGFYVSIGSRTFFSGDDQRQFVLFQLAPELFAIGIEGSFSRLAPSTAAGRADYDYNDVVLVFGGQGSTVVPEPSTFALLIAGLGALGFAARRRNA